MLKRKTSYCKWWSGSVYIQYSVWRARRRVFLFLFEYHYFEINISTVDYGISSLLFVFIPRFLFDHHFMRLKRERESPSIIARPLIEYSIDVVVVIFERLTRALWIVNSNDVIQSVRREEDVNIKANIWLGHWDWVKKIYMRSLYNNIVSL